MKSTRSASNTSPTNKCPLPDSSGHFRTQMRCQCGLRRTLTPATKSGHFNLLTTRPAITASLAHDMSECVKDVSEQNVNHVLELDTPPLSAPTHVGTAALGCPAPQVYRAATCEGPAKHRPAILSTSVLPATPAPTATLPRMPRSRPPAPVSPPLSAANATPPCKARTSPPSASDT